MIGEAKKYCPNRFAVYWIPAFARMTGLLCYRQSKTMKNARSPGRIAMRPYRWRQRPVASCFLFPIYYLLSVRIPQILRRQIDNWFGFHPLHVPIGKGKIAAFEMDVVR